MKRRDPGFDPELEVFLKHRTIERRVPSGMRARVLARARATLAAGGTLSPVPPPLPPPQAPMAVPAARVQARFRVALAISVAVAGAAVGAVAALHGRGVRAPQATSPESPPPVRNAPVTSAGSPSSEPSLADTERLPAARPSRPAHAGPKGDPFTAELDLLQRAHAAYTHREFSVALALVAEHARRFSRGRLAEQREALRVRSLSGSGRADEAHRAAAAFAVRFPRSVLLPRIDGESESSEP